MDNPPLDCQTDLLNDRPGTTPGNTRLITDSSGTVVGTTSFNPNEQVTAESGTITAPFGFAGRSTDGQIGLVDMRARWYDPGTGRLVSQDPLVLLTQQPYA